MSRQPVSIGRVVWTFIFCVFVVPPFTGMIVGLIISANEHFSLRSSQNFTPLYMGIGAVCGLAVGLVPGIAIAVHLWKLARRGETAQIRKTVVIAGAATFLICFLIFLPVFLGMPFIPNSDPAKVGPILHVFLTYLVAPMVCALLAMIVAALIFSIRHFFGLVGVDKIDPLASVKKSGNQSEQ